MPLLEVQILQLDFADLHGGVVLAMAALDLVLVGFLELEDRELLGAALLNDLAGDGGLGGVVAGENALVVGMDGQDGTKLDLLANVALDALDADSVARRDTVLLTSGLNHGVHRSSEC